MYDVKPPDYHRATRLAYRTLLATAADRLPIDVEAIVGCCQNTHVLSYSAAYSLTGETFLGLRDGPSKLAMTIRRDADDETHYLIVWQDCVLDRRSGLYRFTLAHELGHIVLRHARGDSPAEEAEANCFAQHLLCPRPALEAMRPTNYVDVSFACDVSYSVARIAFAALHREGHCVDRDMADGIRQAFHLTDQRPIGDYVPRRCRSSWERERVRVGPVLR